MSSAHNDLKTPLMQNTASRTIKDSANLTKNLVSALPMLTKYAKIQPVIFIKPKPSAMPPGYKLSFNPQYDPQASASSFFGDDLAANIYVLRKWVLPTCPRPGRKPMDAAATPNAVFSGEEGRGLAKKRFKGPKNAALVDALSPPTSAGVGSPGSISMSPSWASPVANHASSMCSSGVESSTSFGEDPGGSAVPAETGSKPASKQFAALQEAYLATLREHELIWNYIDTLLNQITELRFVQSGIITVDALNSTNDAKTKVLPLQTSDQLDHINNVRDLEKFLAHQINQSNVFHSVTKKCIDEGSGARNPIQLQVDYYLRLRRLHRSKNGTSASGIREDGLAFGSLRIKLSNGDATPPDPKLISTNSNQPTTESAKVQSAPTDMLGVGICSTISDVIPDSSNMRSHGMSSAGVELSTSGGGMGLLDHDSLKSFKPSAFTPSLLRPLEIDLFDEDFLCTEPVDIYEKLKNDDPELEFVPLLKQAAALGRKKFTCGFCSGETPCLCFDADNIFGDK
ncbi:hypothetical protein METBISCDRAFT_27141 [Metschnikowia bicuspidata]|uniref:Hap4 transcription factor heteromerisation domain-containing protein n=1 Tax=Metschnikowia bicuspidata TaxID=27322 RepID=A0A4P9ZCW8_9ASCO|nr:hypothetical protein METBISCDRAFT_27141 [Metschnikowia bicuspidata]